MPAPDVCFGTSAQSSLMNKNEVGAESEPKSSAKIFQENG